MSSFEAGPSRGANSLVGPAAAAFGLPAMPVPYEDFGFSLNLPSNIEPSDLDLVASSDFDSILGIRPPGLGPPPPPAPTAGSSDWLFGPSADASDPPPVPPSSGDALGLSSHPSSDHAMGSHSLFDDKEASFLTSFLEGFEGSWDFNPSLPEGMPSFADAEERMATSMANFHAASPAKQSPVSSSRAKQGGSIGALPKNRRHGSSGSYPSPSAILDGRTPPALGSFHNHPTPTASASSVFGGPPRMGGGSGEWEDEQAEAASPDHTEGSKVGDAAGARKNKRSKNGWSGSTQSQPIYHPSNLAQVQQQQQQHEMDLDGPSAGRPTPKMRKKASAAAAAAAAAVAAAAAEEEEAEDSGSGEAGRQPPQLTEGEKRQNHILSEQRRRNHIREAFKDLVELLDAGRAFGARGLGLSSGMGTGIEDEGLDDRDEEDVGPDEDADEAARAKRRRRRLAAATKPKGKGRGRGGSAGGGAGSKSAVLFQAVDLIRWIEGRNAKLREQCEVLEAATANAAPRQRAAA